jgi:hypothetical protein
MKYWFLLGLAALPALAGPNAQTEREFAKYIAARESARERTANASGTGFLWIDQYPDLAASAKNGEIVIRGIARKNPLDVADGLAHDWIGTAFIPGATLAQTLAFVQNYDNHKRVYAPEVVDSKTLSHNGDRYKAFLRLRKQKVITVILNSEHDVVYTRLSPQRAMSRSVTTKIAEVDDPGEPSERELGPNDDHGFLWRLNSYWRFEERDGGVWIECEAISLTRDVPFGLGALIRPIIRDLPVESLNKTLEATRNGLKR